MANQTWQQVAESDLYKQADSETQAATRADFFKQHVAPQLDAADIQPGWSEFDRRANPGMLDRALTTIKGATAPLQQAGDEFQMQRDTAAPAPIQQRPGTFDDGMLDALTREPVNAPRTIDMPGSVFDGKPVAAPANTGNFAADSRNARAAEDRQAKRDSMQPLEAPPSSGIGDIARGLVNTPRIAAGQMGSATFRALGDMTASDFFKEAGKNLGKQYSLDELRKDPHFNSQVATSAYNGLKSAVVVLAALPTGSPLIALSGLTGAQAYQKYRDRGATPTMAGIGALGEGAVEYLTELMPMSYLAGKLGKVGAGEFLSGFAGREAITEQWATALQDAIDTAIANPKTTWRDYLAQRPNAALQTLVSTFTAVGALGAVNKAAYEASGQGASDRDTKRTEGFTPNAAGSATAAKFEQLGAWKNVAGTEMSPPTAVIIPDHAVPAPTASVDAAALPGGTVPAAARFGIGARTHAVGTNADAAPAPVGSEMGPTTAETFTPPSSGMPHEQAPDAGTQADLAQQPPASQQTAPGAPATSTPIPADAPSASPPLHQQPEGAVVPQESAPIPKASPLDAVVEKIAADTPVATTAASADAPAAVAPAAVAASGDDPAASDLEPAPQLARAQAITEELRAASAKNATQRADEVDASTLLGDAAESGGIEIPPAPIESPVADPGRPNVVQSPRADAIRAELRAALARKGSSANADAYGASNKLVTAERAEHARALLRKKLGTLNAGVDPEIMQAGLALAAFHIEAGARAFHDFVRVMVADVGDAIRPHLRTIYEALRPSYEHAGGMTPAAEIAADRPKAVDVKAAPERRADGRKTVDQMTPEEMRRELLAERSEGAGPNETQGDQVNQEVKQASVSDELKAMRKPSLSAKQGPLETPLRLAFTATGAIKVWRGAFRLFEKMGSVVLDNEVGEHIKAGIVDKYGLDAAVVDRRKQAMVGMIAGVRKVEYFLDKLGSITRAEAAALYVAATNKDQAVIDDALGSLPIESRQVLDEIKALVDELGQEQVRLGNMKAETFERNRWAYLHRSYLKWESDQTKSEKASRALRTKGDQYKQRGIVQAFDGARLVRMLPDYWGAKIKDGKIDNGIIGTKFIRYERRANTGEGVDNLPGIDGARPEGRLLEVVYHPADSAVPARLDGWKRDGEWEVRRIEGSKVIFWRDFTAAERQRMGEIDDVRYAMAKTIHQATHDIEVGRYFEWLASHYAKPEDQLPHDANIKDASEFNGIAYTKDSWVKVPETKVRGTGANVYGKLAGLYVPGPIWNDMRQISRPKSQGVLKSYETLLRYWKISKTALSPAVHMNNVMANVAMADWHDVNSAHVVKALRVLLRKGSDAEAKRLFQAFEDNGGELGMFSLTELQKDQLGSLLDELEAQARENGELNGMLNASAFVSLLREGKLREAVGALGQSKAGKASTALPKLMMAAYAAEDQVFRMAAFIKAKQDGLSDREAGKFARRSFLDYEINAPWVQFARRSLLPFISFSYRAIPMLYETARDKPWKLIKLGLMAGALNALGYGLSGGDEDEERKWLPKEKTGRVWGVVPKLVRMPWNDSNGSPVFLDIRRWVPVGDVFDLDQGHSALPIPPALQPGGPLAVLGEIVLNRVGFTGKNIVDDIDTGGERAAKVADHIFKWAVPNLPIPNLPAMAVPGLDKGQLQTYAWTGIENAESGRTDAFGREQSTTQAFASAFGVKLGSYAVDVQRSNRGFELKRELREMAKRRAALGREHARGGLTDDEFADRMVRERERAQRAMRKFRQRG